MNDEKKATNIYVLSIPRIPGEYKLGIHTSTLKKLYQRYETSVHDVQIHYFFKHVDALKVEQKILQQHDQSRITKKRTQHKSEWLNIKLDVLLLDLMMEFIGNPSGRNDSGVFVIDKLIKEIEGETVILNAEGHAVLTEEDYQTTSDDESDETSSEEQLDDDDIEIISIARNSY
jgi:hypothetical protein